MLLLIVVLHSCFQERSSLLGIWTSSHRNHHLQKGRNHNKRSHRHNHNLSNHRSNRGRKLKMKFMLRKKQGALFSKRLDPQTKR
jgi:hypothetical protein